MNSIFPTKSISLTKYTAFLICAMFFSSVGYSQQVIGEFPIMDGGMESETAGTIQNIGSSAIGTSQTSWSVSSSSNAAQRLMVDDATLARTGRMSAELAVAMGASNVRLQTPSTVAPNALDTSKEYTIQFFYKANTDPGTFLDGGIYLNNTSGGSAGDIDPVGGFTPGTWVKGYETRTTNTIYDLSNWAVARISVSPIDSYLDTIKFDDFVVYAGPYDSLAPAAPTAPATYIVSGGMANLTWTAPAGGVDGGGYVVVKYLSMPAADNDLNQNGIYAVGSTTTNGTASLLGEVVYIGTDLSYSDTYTAGAYYKVYAADKAFNYSEEVTIAPGLPASIYNNEITNLVIYPNPATDKLNIESQDFVIDDVAVYSIDGKLILEKTKLENNSINVSSLATGTYLLKLYGKSGEATKQFVVE